jgi:6-pyruvoyltetrahydropterin/6-carboxytetrahydropterin synthase
MFVITKDFALSVSHQLHGLRDGHPCARLHGHNVTVRVELQAEELDGVGFVLDYGDLAPLGDWLDAEFDHRHLNDVVDFNPTAEHMADHIFAWCAERGWPVSAVGWSETPKTWAWIRP